MLTVELSEFLVQLKNGSINNVGPPTKHATIKLYDIETVEGRAFGDERVKLVFEDDADNTVEVALFPDELRSILDDVERVREGGRVEGFGDEQSDETS